MAWGSPPKRKRGRATIERGAARAAKGGPASVLGATGGVANESYLPGKQVNQGTEAGGPLGGAERVGKKFVVGFTADGKVVHLYGSDVPKAQRRQVLGPPS